MDGSAGCEFNVIAYRVFQASTCLFPFKWFSIGITLCEMLGVKEAA